MTLTLAWDSIISTLAFLVALAGWIAVNRKNAIAEGRRQQTLQVIVERLEAVEKKSEYLRGCNEESSVELKALKTDMDWVKLTLQEIKDLLAGRGFKP